MSLEKLEPELGYDSDGPRNTLRTAAPFPFNDQTTFGQLNSYVHSASQVEQAYQLLYRNDQQIGLVTASTDTLAGLELKQGETIIVKHLYLRHWSYYLDQVDAIRKLTASGMTHKRKDMAIRGREQLSLLDASKFFHVYPKLDLQRNEINKEISFLVHNTKKHMRRALILHFSSLFEDQQIELLEKPRKMNGVQLGMFVFVKDTSDQVIRSYYAKTIGNILKAEFTPNEKLIIDFIELFVYQLLKVIGIRAPEVHLVPDGLRSECIYLATKLIEHFLTASGGAVNEMLGHTSSEELTTKKNIVVDGKVMKPLNILVALLALEDVIENKGNYGFIERKPTEEGSEGGEERPSQELRIVDFRVNLALGSRISKSREEILYLKKYFDKWDIIASIDKARKLVEEDKTLKDNRNTNMDIFDIYIRRLKTKLQDFVANPRKASAGEGSWWSPFF